MAMDQLLEQSHRKAKKYLRQRLNNPYCAYLYGSILLGEKNMHKAGKYITKAAECGLPDAINSLGDGFYSGDIRKKSVRKALEHYIKAAKLGFGPAQFNAGVVYYRHGNGLKALNKSVYWLTKAARNSQNVHLKPYILLCKQNVQKKIGELSQ